MRHTKLFLAALAVMVAAGCAVKPDEKVAAGQDENLFKKSEILGRSVATAQSGTIFFDGLARSKSELNATQRQLLKSLDAASGFQIADTDAISFTISEAYLSVNRLAVGPADILVQFKIEGHFDLETQRTADGADTQYLGKSTSKHGRWQDREYIEVNPADPLKIKANSDALQHLYTVAELQTKKIKLTSLDDLEWLTPSDRAELAKLFGLKADDTVMTTLSRQRFSLFKVDAEDGLTILAHAEVRYFDLVQTKDDEGQLVPELERNTTAEWSQRAFVEVNPDGIKIAKASDDITKNLFLKKDLDGKTFVLGKDKIPVLSLNADVTSILARGLVEIKKGALLTLKVAKDTLNVFAGADLVMQYALTHYDVGPTKDADGEVTATITLLQDRPLKHRLYVKLDPNDPLPVLLSENVVANAHQIIKKSDLKSGCMTLATLAIPAVKAALATEGLAVDAIVCLEVTQTILSISVKEGDAKRLVTTFDIAGHIDIDVERGVDGELHRQIVVNQMEPNWEKREHVLIVASAPHRVESLVRANALDKSTLSGEFIYTATVTEAHSENGVVFEGVNLQSPDRLELKMDEGSITAYKVNEPLNDSGARSPVLRYGIDHFDVGRVTNGYGDETNVIAEMRDQPWKQRRNVRIDFASNEITSYFNDLLGIEKLYSGMVFTARSKLAGEVAVDQGMISFETEEVVTPNARADYFGTGETFLEPVAIKIKHVFLRVGTRNYTAKEYDDLDFMRFGFFRTTEYGVDPVHGKTDATLKHFLHRFDVSNGKQIDYYLSPGFPEKFKDEAREAIAAWNVAFKAAIGREDVIVLHEDMTPDHGDPRYNMIVYVDGANSQSPLGFGPSFFDPITGENLSAKAYMYGDGMRYVMNSASDYYDLATGNRNALDFAVRGPLAPIPTGSDSLQPLARILHPLARALPKNKVAAADVVRRGAGGSPLAAGIALSKVKAHGSVAGEAMRSASTPVLQSMQLAFKDKVLEEQKLSFGARQQGCVQMPDYHLASAIKFIAAHPGKTKAEILTEVESRTFFTTLVHELGHNLGLRHNFHGSFDEVNFPDEYHLLKTLGQAGSPQPFGEDEWIYKYRGSSVMDYSDDFEALYKKAGPYDVAAIKYGYGDLLERVVGQDDSGALVTEDISRDDLVAAKDEIRVGNPGASEATIDGLAMEQLSIRPYKFCTDEHVANDPTCRRFDRGVSLAESTQSLVEDYETLYHLYGFRRGRRMFTGSSNHVLNRYILPVRQLLDEYVYNIVTNSFRTQDLPDGTPQAGSQGDFIQAINIGIRFYDKILSTLEPGDYHLDAATGELVAGRSADVDAKNLVVTLRDGKYLDARSEFIGDNEQVLNRGTELDKIGVLWAMSMRGYPADKYERASLSMNYFDMLREFTLETFSKVMRDDYKIDVTAVKPEGSSDYVLVNREEIEAAEPTIMTAKIKPSISLSLRQYASIFAITGFDSSANKSFADYIDVRVKGVNDVLPDGTPTAVFKSATGVKTYVVPNTADGQSISYAIAAKAAVTATQLAALNGQALPDTAVLKADAVVLFGVAWALGEGAPMGDETVAILNDNFDGNRDIMQQLVAQWVDNAADPAVKEQLVAVQVQLAAKLAEYAGAAQVGGDIAAQIEDLNRELLQYEADLLNMNSLYKVLN